MLNYFINELISFIIELKQNLNKFPQFRYNI